MLAAQIGGHEGMESRHANTEKLGSGGLCSLMEKLLHPESLVHFFFIQRTERQGYCVEINKATGLVYTAKQEGRFS